MSASDAVFWGSGALMWIVTGAAYAWMRHWRLQLEDATAHMRRQLAEHQQDAPLAEWCRHMSVTVVTVTGAVFSATFAELQASEASTVRNWHVPTQVIIWSDLEETLLPPLQIESIGDPFPGFPREDKR